MDPAVAAAAPSVPIDDITDRIRRSASPDPGLSTLRGCGRAFCVKVAGLGGAAGALLPERTRPSAMLHSKTAMFSSVHAVRTALTARISSDVSITRIGVEELIRILRRSSVSLIQQLSVVGYQLSVIGLEARHLTQRVVSNIRAHLHPVLVSFV